jgi:hypothetical protein
VSSEPWIEPARSGRSRCYACGDPIPKGALRFSFAEGDLPGWFHLTCAAVCFAEVEPLMDDWTGPGGAELDEARRRMSADRPGGPVCLDEAVAAATRRDWPVVLREVLAAWRACRDVRLARLADALTDDAVRDVGGIPTGPALDAFLDRLDPSDPVQRGLRIRAAVRAKKREMPAVLGEAFVGPLDPRWVDLVLPWFETPPWRDAAALWRRVLMLAERTLDPRLEEALDGLRYSAPLPMGAVAGYWVREWSTRHPEGALSARRAAATELSTDQVAQLEAIVRALAKGRVSAADATEQVRGLVQRGARGDDAALLVLADRHAAVDDPRGEYIQLALRADRAGKAAARKLERTSWRSLLGALAPVVFKRGLVFERGLPVEVVASSRKPSDIDAVRDATEWASVRTLHLVPPAGQTEAILGLVTPAQTGLVTIRATLTPASLSALLSEGPEMPTVRTIEVVAPWSGLQRGMLSVDRCRFPNLEVLVLPPTWDARLRAHARTRLPGVEIRVAHL